MVDRALGKERAVKFVRPDRIHDPTNFYSEPHALVALKHDHVVEVHDAGTLTDGRIYIAMEYLPAGSVEDRYKGAIVPLADALAIVADACRGVEYAHSKGFIHRDIKPANLLIENGHAKVSDFGLATRTTGSGIASPYGYVSHCAPEVLDPGEATVSTDVYALGMTLYRLVNGDSILPDPAALGMPLDDAIVAGQFPDRGKFLDHVPKSVRMVVRKAIAFDRSKRIASPADLRHDIERVMPEVSFVETPTREIAEWEGRSGTHEWAASIQKQGDAFRFEIRRARIGGSPAKRVVSDCQAFKTAADARKHARKVFNKLGKPRG